MTTADLTDAQYETADRIVAALENADSSGLVRSAVARKAKADYDDARHILNWLVAGRYIHTSGSGSRTRYHAGRN